MQQRTLGNSTLDITRIGLGAWAIGGEWRFGWGPQDDAESTATIRRAIDLGINWIDTAAIYGLGHSEEMVGRALRDVPASGRPYVFTKCSLVWDASGNVTHNLTSASIRREVDASLKRLQTERIDLYQIHWPAWPSSPPDYTSPGSIEEAWETLVSLRREGKVAWIGVSNFDAAQLRRIGAIEQPTSLQPPYSLIRREVEAETLPYCLEHNIGVISYAPMQSGLLTGKMTRERLMSLPEGDFRRNNKFFQEPTFGRAMTIVDRLREIGSRHGRAPGEAAIAWVLSHPAVTAAIVGARRPDQIEGTLGAATLALDSSEIAQLEEET